MNNFEKLYYKDHFTILSHRSKWLKTKGGENVPKVSDVIIVLADFDPKIRHDSDEVLSPKSNIPAINLVIFRLYT